jgi:transcriptional regulator with XRE-family HTH domain
MARASSARLRALRYWRVRRGLTQRRLAEQIGVRRNTVWRIEAGYPARARTAFLLASALRVSVVDLVHQPSGRMT